MCSNVYPPILTLKIWSLVFDTLPPSVCSTISHFGSLVTINIHCEFIEYGICIFFNSLVSIYVQNLVNMIEIRISSQIIPNWIKSYSDPIQLGSNSKVPLYSPDQIWNEFSYPNLIEIEFICSNIPYESGLLTSLIPPQFYMGVCNLHLFFKQEGSILPCCGKTSFTNLGIDASSRGRYWSGNENWFQSPLKTCITIRT